MVFVKYLSDSDKIKEIKEYIKCGYEKSGILIDFEYLRSG